MTVNDLHLGAGWYTDPQDPNAQRWWNGSQWTSHSRSAEIPWDSTGLEGQPPTTFLAVDAPLVTIASAPADTAMLSPAEPYSPDQTLHIPPGWYPDPTGLPAQRWWDGMEWSDRTAPLVDPRSRHQGFVGAPPIAPAYYQPTMVLVTRPKSVGVAFLLTFFFGPLGMFYSTVSGALIMLAVLIFGGFVAGVVTLGLAWLVWWPLVWLISIVWGCVAADKPPATAVIHTGAPGYHGYPPRY